MFCSCVGDTDKFIVPLKLCDQTDEVVLVFNGKILVVSHFLPVLEPQSEYYPLNDDSNQLKHPDVFVSQEQFLDQHSQDGLLAHTCPFLDTLLREDDVLDFLDKLITLIKENGLPSKAILGFLEDKVKELAENHKDLERGPLNSDESLNEFNNQSPVYKSNHPSNKLSIQVTGDDILSVTGTPSADDKLSLTLNGIDNFNILPSSKSNRINDFTGIPDSIAPSDLNRNSVQNPSFFDNNANSFPDNIVHPSFRNSPLPKVLSLEVTGSDNLSVIGSPSTDSKLSLSLSGVDNFSVLPSPSSSFPSPLLPSSSAVNKDGIPDIIDNTLPYHNSDNSLNQIKPNIPSLEDHDTTKFNNLGYPSSDNSLNSLHPINQDNPFDHLSSETGQFTHENPFEHPPQPFDSINDQNPTDYPSSFIADNNFDHPSHPYNSVEQGSPLDYPSSTSNSVNKDYPLNHPGSTLESFNGQIPKRLSIEVSGNDLLSITGSPSSNNDKLSLSINGVDKFNVQPSASDDGINKINLSNDFPRVIDSGFSKDSIINVDKNYDHPGISNIDNLSFNSSPSNKILSLEVTGSDSILNVIGSPSPDNKLSLSLTGVDNFNVVSTSSPLPASLNKFENPTNRDFLPVSSNNFPDEVNSQSLPLNNFDIPTVDHPFDRPLLDYPSQTLHSTEQKKPSRLSIEVTGSDVLSVNGSPSLDNKLSLSLTGVNNFNVLPSRSSDNNFDKTSPDNNQPQYDTVGGLTKHIPTDLNKNYDLPVGTLNNLPLQKVLSLEVTGSDVNVIGSPSSDSSTLSLSLSGVDNFNVLPLPINRLSPLSSSKIYKNPVIDGLSPSVVSHLPNEITNEGSPFINYDTHPLGDYDHGLRDNLGLANPLESIEHQKPTKLSIEVMSNDILNVIGSPSIDNKISLSLSGVSNFNVLPSTPNDFDKITSNGDWPQFNANNGLSQNKKPGSDISVVNGGSLPYNDSPSPNVLSLEVTGGDNMNVVGTPTNDNMVSLSVTGIDNFSVLPTPSSLQPTTLSLNNYDAPYDGYFPPNYVDYKQGEVEDQSLPFNGNGYHPTLKYPSKTLESVNKQNPNKLSIEITGNDLLSLAGSPSLNNDKLSLLVTGVDNFNVIQPNNPRSPLGRTRISSGFPDDDRDTLLKHVFPKSYEIPFNSDIDKIPSSNSRPQKILSLEITGTDDLGVVGSQLTDNTLALSLTGVDNFSILPSSSSPLASLLHPAISSLNDSPKMIRDNSFLQPSTVVGDHTVPFRKYLGQLGKIKHPSLIHPLQTLNSIEKLQYPYILSIGIVGDDKFHITGSPSTSNDEVSLSITGVEDFSILPSFNYPTVIDKLSSDNLSPLNSGKSAPKVNPSLFNQDNIAPSSNYFDKQPYSKAFNFDNIPYSKAFKGNDRIFGDRSSNFPFNNPLSKNIVSVEIVGNNDWKIIGTQSPVDKTLNLDLIRFKHFNVLPISTSTVLSSPLYPSTLDDQIGNKIDENSAPGDGIHFPNELRSLPVSLNNNNFLSPVDTYNNNLLHPDVLNSIKQQPLNKFSLRVAGTDSLRVSRKQPTNNDKIALTVSGVDDFDVVALLDFYDGPLIDINDTTSPYQSTGAVIQDGQPVLFPSEIPSRSYNPHYPKFIPRSAGNKLNRNPLYPNNFSGSRNNIGINNRKPLGSTLRRNTLSIEVTGSDILNLVGTQSFFNRDNKLSLSIIGIDNFSITPSSMMSPNHFDLMRPDNFGFSVYENEITSTETHHNYFDYNDTPLPTKDHPIKDKVYKIVSTDTTTTTITETFDSKLCLLITGLDEFGVVSQLSPNIRDVTSLPNENIFHRDENHNLQNYNEHVPYLPNNYNSTDDYFDKSSFEPTYPRELEPIRNKMSVKFIGIDNLNIVSSPGEPDKLSLSIGLVDRFEVKPTPKLSSFGDSYKGRPQNDIYSTHFNQYDEFTTNTQFNKFLHDGQNDISTAPSINEKLPKDKDYHQQIITETNTLSRKKHKHTILSDESEYDNLANQPFGSTKSMQHPLTETTTTAFNANTYDQENYKFNRDHGDVGSTLDSRELKDDDNYQLILTDTEITSRKKNRLDILQNYDDTTNNNINGITSDQLKSDLPVKQDANKFINTEFTDKYDAIYGQVHDKFNNLPDKQLRKDDRYYQDVITATDITSRTKHKYSSTDHLDSAGEPRNVNIREEPKAFITETNSNHILNTVIADNNVSNQVPLSSGQETQKDVTKPKSNHESAKDATKSLAANNSGVSLALMTIETITITTTVTDHTMSLTIYGIEGFDVINSSVVSPESENKHDKVIENEKTVTEGKTVKENKFVSINEAPNIAAVEHSTVQKDKFNNINNSFERHELPKGDTDENLSYVLTTTDTSINKRKRTHVLNEFAPDVDNDVDGIKLTSDSQSNGNLFTVTDSLHHLNTTTDFGDNHYRQDDILQKDKVLPQSDYDHSLVSNIDSIRSSSSLSNENNIIPEEHNNFIDYNRDKENQESLYLTKTTTDTVVNKRKKIYENTLFDTLENDNILHPDSNGVSNTNIDSISSTTNYNYQDNLTPIDIQENARDSILNQIDQVPTDQMSSGSPEHNASSTTTEKTHHTEIYDEVKYVESLHHHHDTKPTLSIINLNNLNIAGSVLTNTKGISFNIVGPDTKAVFKPDEHDKDKVTLVITGIDQLGVESVSDTPKDSNLPGLAISGIGDLDLTSILPPAPEIQPENKTEPMPETVDDITKNDKDKGEYTFVITERETIRRKRSRKVRADGTLSSSEEEEEELPEPDNSQATMQKDTTNNNHDNETTDENNIKNKDDDFGMTNKKNSDEVTLVFTDTKTEKRKKSDAPHSDELPSEKDIVAAVMNKLQSANQNEHNFEPYTPKVRSPLPNSETTVSTDDESNESEQDIEEATDSEGKNLKKNKDSDEDSSIIITTTVTTVRRRKKKRKPKREKPPAPVQKPQPPVVKRRLPAPPNGSANMPYMPFRPPSAPVNLARRGPPVVRPPAARSAAAKSPVLGRKLPRPV